MLLDVFAVIALFAGQAEEAFFEDGIAAVPESQGETDQLVAVADARMPSSFQRRRASGLFAEKLSQASPSAL